MSELLPRSLPLRVEPLEGEGLDSWIQAHAHRNGVSITTLIRALGLASGSGSVPNTMANLSTVLTPAQARRAAHASAVSPQRIHRMTLAAYAPAAVHIDSSRTTLAASSPWLRPRGSRFCPQCLHDNGGRWMIGWQLSWVFACTTHQALLRDVCPSCLHVPRRPLRQEGPPSPPGICASINRTHPRLRGQWCISDLAEAAPIPLDRHDRRLLAQARLHELLQAVLDATSQTRSRQLVHSNSRRKHHQTSPAAPSNAIEHAGQVFNDLDALARWFLATASEADCTLADAADSAARRSEMAAKLAAAQSASGRLRRVAAIDADLSALALTWALDIVNTANAADTALTLNADATDAGGHPRPSRGAAPVGRAQLIEDLTRRRRRLAIPTSITNPSRRIANDVISDRSTAFRSGNPQGFRPLGMRLRDWQTLSAPIVGLLLHAGDPDLPKTERLRALTPTAGARLPPADGKLSAQRARWIPQLIWPEWLIRLLPQTTQPFSDRHRAALTAALRLPGLPLSVPVADVTARSHPHLSHLGVALMLRRYCDEGHSSVLAALCDLAEGLDQHGSPINYHRRLRLITVTNLLTAKRWENLCEQAGMHPGKGRRLSDARRYLFTTLTGADLTDPGHSLAYTGNSDRSQYTAFLEAMGTPMRPLLLHHATEHLQQLGIDEPLTWSPPVHWLTSIQTSDLPGRDPDDIDLATLQHLIAQNVPVSTAARHLATSTDHVRLALENLARPRGPGHRNWTMRRRADRMLTKAFFETEYLTNHKTLRQIAQETGFPRRILARYTQAAGIELRPNHPPTDIDPDWLREQYLHRRRPYEDIAQQLGVKNMTVIRAARRFDIPSRSTGVHGRPELAPLPNAALTDDIRNATEGHLHAWSRLERFATAMTYPSITQAAEAMNVSPRTLVNQFHRLENDIGATLYHRATPARPQQPTPRGQALIRDLARPEVQAQRPPRARPAARGSAGKRSISAQALRASIRQTRPRQPPTTPPTIRRATQNHAYGWRRLQRFATTMTYPTLTDASTALGLTPGTLIQQLQRLETDVGQKLFHRATAAGRPHRPTRHGVALLHAFNQPDIQTLYARSHANKPSTKTPRPARPRPPEPECPEDIRRAVHGTKAGWTRLERFAITMTHPDMTKASLAIGIERTTLLEQLRRLETDVGHRLFHRATADGHPHRPTGRGANLLRNLADPPIRALATNRTRINLTPTPRTEEPTPPPHSPGNL